MAVVQTYVSDRAGLDSTTDSLPSDTQTLEKNHQNIKVMMGNLQRAKTEARMVTCKNRSKENAMEYLVASTPDRQFTQKLMILYVRT